MGTREIHPLPKAYGKEGVRLHSRGLVIQPSTPGIINGTNLWLSEGHRLAKRELGAQRPNLKPQKVPTRPLRMNETPQEQGMRVYKDIAQGPRGAVGVRRCPSPAGSGPLLPPSLRPRWEPVGRGRSSRTPLCVTSGCPALAASFWRHVPNSIVEPGGLRSRFGFWRLFVVVPPSPPPSARVSPGVSGC